MSEQAYEPDGGGAQIVSGLSGPQNMVGAQLPSDAVAQLLAQAPYAVAVLDRDLRYLACSEKFKSDYNLVGQDLKGRHQFDVFPDISDDWKDRLQRCLAGERFEGQETFYKDNEGYVEWIKSTLVPWYSNSDIAGVMLFTEFVSNEKRLAAKHETDKKFLGAVLDNIHDAVVACDAAGQLTVFNQAARDLHGLPEEPLPPEQWAAHYDLFEADGVTPMGMQDIPLFRALTDGAASKTEMVVAPKGRTPHKLIANGAAIIDDVGEKLGAVATMHDITEQALAEAKLRESEQELKGLYNLTPVMLHSVDMDGRLIRVGDHWIKTLGYNREEVIGRHFSDLLPPKSRDYVRDIVLPQFQNTGRVDEAEFQVRKKNGGLIDIQLAAFVKRDDAGQPEYSLTVLTDIMNRKRAEEAVRLSAQQFRGVFESSPQGLAIISIDGQVLLSNAALSKMLGYPEDELRTYNIEQLTHPKDQKRDSDCRKKLLARDIESFQHENKYVRKDGSTLWALSSVSAVWSDEGRPIHLVVQVLDLSERKVAEERLAQSHKLEAIGQLTGGLAHDFNNLLAVILISLQLLERSHKDDPKTLERVRNALDATERGAELTRRLLAFARKQTLEQSVIHIGALLEGMTPLLRRALGGLVDLEIHEKDDLPAIEVDANQLETCILNLAINSRDAMPSGGRLTIETKLSVLDQDYVVCHPDVNPGTYVQVTVSDSGTGIPENIVDQVFEPFFTTKEAGRGTGLGLSMVYGFVRQSKGHIEIYSEEGVGTSVKVYLPAQEGGPEENALHSAEPADSDLVGSEHILVVEDDPDVRRSSVELLESFGYRVCEAESADEALKRLGNDPTIELVFSDIIMPGGLNGIELGQRAKDMRSDLRVLLTTGFAEAAIARGNAQTHTFDILGKPYRREEVGRKLREVLDG